MAAKSRYLSTLFFLSLPVLLASCSATPSASSLDFQQMVINLAKTMPSLLGMFTAGAYVLGFTLMLKGIYKLKEYGEMRTSMSSHTNLWPPLITLGIGTMLIFFVSTYHVGLTTLFGDDSISPIAYSNGSGTSEELMNAVVSIMQVIGVIAFIRGLLLLNSASSPNAQHGSIGKGMTFVVGGLLAINVYGTWQMLINTLLG